MEDITPSLSAGPGNTKQTWTSTCRHRLGGIPSHAGFRVTTASWKSETIVRLSSGGCALRVIGCDSVGSVICRPLGGGSGLDIYVPPSLLVLADPDASAPEPSTKFAAENA